MYKIVKNNCISIVKGDYIKFPIELYIGTFPKRSVMQLEEGDTAYFGIMEAQDSFDQAILKKALTVDDLDEYGNLWVTLLPEDTINLDVGTYYYEIKVLYEEDGVEHIDTVINKSRFIVLD